MKLQDYQEISNVSEAIKLAVQKYTDPEIETTEQDSAFVFLLSKANEGNTEAQDALEDECNLSLGDLVLDYSCQWAFDRMNTNGFDEYDEDLYHEELICIYKRYSYDDDRNPLFTYEISISVINPGLYKEDIDFKQRLEANKELTVEYLETLRGVFGI